MVPERAVFGCARRLMISSQAALIYTMVLVSAADRNMTDAELKTIGDIVGHLPIFREYDRKLIPQTAMSCADLLNEDSGLETALTLIHDSLGAELRETAYALACEVAAADGQVTQEELRLLELIRYGLKIDRLIAAGIERGARARHQRL
jgi:tellurite resistance protein